MKKKGFTLIELLAVLVILAIIALIAIPIVIRTINNSEEQTEKQSILGYARAIENDIANYMMINPGKKYTDYVLPDNLDYKGNEVECDKPIKPNANGKLKLTCCKVVGGTGTGYDYENGKLEKSTDTSCNAKEENNEASNNTDNETNNDSSNNEASQSNNVTYEVGEEVTVKEEKYNVIGIGNDYVTLLKQQPLTVSEINTYGGVGTADNHVNKSTRTSIGTSYNLGDSNQTGGLSYYSSSTCRLGKTSGCKNEGAPNYYYSDIKYVVDNWAINTLDGYLKEIDGYKARLIEKEELRSQFYPNCDANSSKCYKESTTPSWVYNSVYWYWTMTEIEDSDNSVWAVSEDGRMNHSYYIFECYNGAVRPVINVLKQYVERVN